MLLRIKKHHVYRINFNVGDAVYWGNSPAWNFRDSINSLPEYLDDKINTFGITDVIMLGDTRPVNQLAIPVAAQYGARIHVLEEGYFRPNWITLEEGGINGYSRLPNNPDWYREIGKLIPNYGSGKSVSNPMYLLALHEIAYHLPNLFNPLLYKGYRTHRPHISGLECYGWGQRFLKMPYFEHHDKREIEQLIRNKDPFYLLPLQLDSDSQIKEHSSSGSMLFFIKKIINSFIRHAPTNAKLVIKNHPLDTGFTDYAAWIKRLQNRLKFTGRILYLETGDLLTLLEHGRGLVTVNSSVGITALIHNCPTIALGKAVYDMPDLTFQGSIDDFWRLHEKPDKKLFHNFKNTLLHTVQLNGGFYSRAGIEMGTTNCCQRLEEIQSPLDKLLEMTHQTVLS